MPFKSKAQERFMYSQHPDIAKRWNKESPVNQSKLPEKVKKHHSNGHVKSSTNKGK